MNTPPLNFWIVILLALIFIAVITIPLRELVPDWSGDIGALQHRVSALESEAVKLRAMVELLSEIGVEIVVVEGVPVIVEMPRKED